MNRLLRMSSWLLALPLGICAQTEMLFNNSFDVGGDYWSVPTGNYKGTITLSNATGGGYDLLFAPSGATYRYSLQAIQTDLSVEPGYRYAITFGGMSTGASRSIQLGIQNSTSYTTYMEPITTISSLYADYKTETVGENVWENCSITDNNVQFFINGGASSTSFKLAWVSLTKTPIDCGGGISSSAGSSSSSTGTGVSSATVSNGKAYANQVAYLTTGPKVLVLKDGTSDPLVFTKSGAEVLSVNAGTASTWTPANQSVRLVDFSALPAGNYSVKQGATILRSDIVVADAPYETLLKALLKFYYYQRASQAIVTPYAASAYVRSKGHSDTSIPLHNSTGESGTLSSSKGWYDAGDYGKYIVNSGISTYTLLKLYEHYPDYFGSLDLNIPESADPAFPDILHEIKWNLDWMLTMQSTVDGGVYHKLTATGFTYFGLPSGDNSSRYVIGKSTSASYDFAAVMALASRVYASFDASYSAKCLAAAKSAYSWAAANPSRHYTNASTSSPAISTGEYRDDGDFSDERIFAATELAQATQSADYDLVLQMTRPLAKVPDWQSVSILAAYSQATANTFFGSRATVASDTILKIADSLVSAAGTGYGIPMRTVDFVWGSNGMAGNQGMLLLHAYYLTADKKYYNAAVAVFDYLLGRNPINKSFVTGFGTTKASNPHHYISENLGVAVPGMVVGGPQNNDNADKNADPTCSYTTTYPALSYYDNYCSYATNEVAINWNAPMAYLAGALQALAAGNKPAVDVAGDPLPALQTPVISRSAGRVLRSDGARIYLQQGERRYDLRGRGLR